MKSHLETERTLYRSLQGQGQGPAGAGMERTAKRHRSATAASASSLDSSSEAADEHFATPPPETELAE